MREIDTIVVHCSATTVDMDIGVSEIREWHKANRWKDIGYHFVIRRDGTEEPGRPIEIPGAHVYGHNDNSIGICLVGGLDDSARPDANFSMMQYETLMNLVGRLLFEFPEASVMGHRELDPKKACPCFDVQSLWSDL